MLTTTVEGLWALQVLTGIETLAPELGLRPILPSVESKQSALAHPVCAGLRAANVIDAAGTVDPAVVEWLTVLARRDVALVMHLRRPDGDAPARVVLARFAQWWVVMERSAEFIRIGGAGTASSHAAATAVFTAQIERLCGAMPAAGLRPVTLDATAFAARVTDAETLRAFLIDQRLDADQLQLMLLAADLRRSAQASVAAIQTGVQTGRSTRTQVGPAVATILDTPQGRLLAERVTDAGNAWMIIAPGTAANIVTAVERLLRQLPAHQDWHSYRKVV